MIKLKDLLMEATKHAFFIGNVVNGDVVNAVKVDDEEADEVGHYDYRLMRGARWRYDSGMRDVEWTTNATDDEKVAVENWLNRKGYEVETHYVGTEKRL